MKLAAAFSRCLLLAAWVIANLPPASALANPVRVGVYENKPKVFIDRAGKPAGFWVDLMDEIAAAEGWRVEYVACYWEQCLQAIEQQQIDLMVDVAYSEERDRRFDFNREVVLASWSVVYARRGMRINTLLDLDQRRIAVLKDSIQYSELVKRADAFDIQPQFVAVDSFAAMFQQLDRGEVDAGVVNRFIGEGEARYHRIQKTNILVNPSHLHFAVAAGKHPDLLAAIDRNLKAQIADPSSPYYQSQRRWFRPTWELTWSSLKYHLVNYSILLALMGLALFAWWNRRLRQEISRRQQAEERLQTLTDNTPGAIYRYLLRADGSDTLLYISSGCQNIFEIEAARALQEVNLLWEKIDPEDAPGFRAAVLQSARDLTSFNYECRISLPSGEQKWLQVVSKPKRQTNGDVIWDGIVSDISERKAAEIALKESESRFQRLADNIPGILYGYRYRSDGTEAFTYLSSGFRDVYGCEPDAALQDAQVVWNRVHPEDIDRLRHSIIESSQNLQVWQCQYRVCLPTEELKWLQGIARPTGQPNGDVLWDGVIIDISDRKFMELAWQRSEQRFRNMAANVPGAIFQYVLHPDGTDAVKYMSPGCYDLWEVTAEAVVENASLLWQMVQAEDRPALYDSVLASAQNLAPWYWQWRIITPSGQLKWLEAAGRPERQENGDVLWDTLIMDISDRKQAEIALQTSESRLATLIGNLPGFVYRAANNPNYTAEFVSEGIADIVGYAPEEFMEATASITYGTLIHPYDRARIWHLVQQALERQQPYEFEYRLLASSGESVWVWERGQGIFEQTGALHHLEGFVTNISSRRQAELALQESERRYRKVVEAQTDFILRSRPDTTITFANQALCQMLGVTPVEIVGRPWLDFANSDDLENYVFPELAHLTPQNPRCFVENRDTRANGQIGWTQWLNEGIFDETGQLIEIQSVGRDITALKQIEQALRASEERLRLVTENMSDLVCLHSPDGRYLYATPSSQALLGYSPAELIGRDPYELFHPDDRERVRESAHLPALEQLSHPIVYRIQQKTGGYIWLETLTKAIVDQTGQVMHLQTTSRDVSDRIKVERQLKHDALHDSLTGLPNRNLLMNRLDLALHRAQICPYFKFAVLFLDLDNFKVVNDSLGHLVGDELLMAVAFQLRSLIRETDLAARLGGDEFVILLEGITARQEAVVVAEQILQSLRSPFNVANREVVISTSIGIVMGATSHAAAADLLRDADLAMYQAKHGGRAQYALFNPTMHQQAMQRLLLEQDLRRALENQEFVLYYQPIVALENLQLKGFEALIRWHHPQRGLIAPSEFIAIAEETGLITSIGQWVLNTACQQLALWRDQFSSCPLKMSVNLSVKQLQSSLIDHLKVALNRSQIPPENLVLEITESMLVQNVAMTCELLSQIRSLGICLSVDDFGTGYSSLSYLHSLPVDTLKIDRAFVSPPETDARNRVIAESILALSDLLELKVIAEGIQTAAQLEWLRQIGCEQGQGYLFSPPVPVSQATVFLSHSLFAT